MYIHTHTHRWVLKCYPWEIRSLLPVWGAGHMHVPATPNYHHLGHFHPGGGGRDLPVADGRDSTPKCRHPTSISKAHLVMDLPSEELVDQIEVPGLANASHFSAGGAYRNHVDWG